MIYIYIYFIRTNMLRYNFVFPVYRKNSIFRVDLMFIKKESVSMFPVDMYLTYLLFISAHVVSKHRATEFISSKETEISRDFTDYSGGETLIETQGSVCP